MGYSEVAPYEVIFSGCQVDHDKISIILMATNPHVLKTDEFLGRFSCC